MREGGWKDAQGPWGPGHIPSLPFSFNVAIFDFGSGGDCSSGNELVAMTKLIPVFLLKQLAQ